MFLLRHPWLKKKRKSVVMDSKNKGVILTKFASQPPLTFCSLSLILF